jgi:hypothetical protein
VKSGQQAGTRTINEQRNEQNQMPNQMSHGQGAHITQALLWGILNTHVNALCIRAAFTTLEFVVQVSAARQAGLLYGSGRCMIRQWLEDRAMYSGKGRTTCSPALSDRLVDVVVDVHG